ncbi:uncharacterized protein LOC119557260 [Drosophila subpulchrella]|uniref:uncharacterized protein LOC119557260 n=1 Tax=Drosophila subpulchrella TaxID=1486046 RepID=UPI0018A1751F|nr:uncharacterized protein LOC119557260 [Drosophila subpulchrella]
MNTVKDIKINSSVWMNRSYSSVLKSAPLPVPGYRGPGHARRFPGSQGQGKPMAPASSKSSANGGHFEGPSTSRYSHYDQAVKEQKRKQGNASMNPGRSGAAKDSEPYFASNLMYYPHLPQPLWVENFQTFADFKKVMSDGDLSQMEPPMQQPAKPEKVHQSRGKSVPPAQVSQDQPSAQAPPRQYSLTRNNAADGPENSLTNLFLSVSNHLLQQPAQQDPLLAQFVARQEEVRLEDDPKKAPRRLQPSWCPCNDEEAYKASGSSKSKPDTPRSWRSEGTAHLLPKKSVAENSSMTRKEK